MFRLRAPRLTTSLIRRADACKALGISERTFERHWHHVFTDPRAPENRIARVRRLVYEDELAVAIEAGGHRGRGKVAVLNYRGQIQRKEIA